MARRIRRAWFLAFTWLVAATAAANAFSLLPDPKTGSVIGDLAVAARWSPEPDPFGYGSGFHDALQVAVAADFAERLEITEPERVALLRQVIRQAFEAWETADLRFDVDFERVPVEGVNHSRATGWEFDLFAVPGSHPAFAAESYFGITRLSRRMADARLLTNGARTDGSIITAVDIYINVDLILPFTMLLTVERQAQALQRLLMHEIGHGLGLGHPNTFNTFNANYDTDMDPLNVMVVDPLDPFAVLMFSEARNPRAIMSNDRNSLGAGIFFTDLQHDDRGGRDALYPSLSPCPGDCSGNARVDVTELITVVNVALGETAIEHCHRADLDRDGGIQVDEILQGVNSALDGCNARAGS
jgi:hypothetical protein